MGLDEHIVRSEHLQVETVKLRLEFIRNELNIATTLANIAAREKRSGRLVHSARLKSKAETSHEKVKSYLSDKRISLAAEDKDRLQDELKLLRDFLDTL